MALVIEHHEDLEADLRAEFRIDLLDFWRGTLTPRALWLFVRKLPLESRFWRAAAPRDALIGTWKPTDYILADLIDLYRSAHSDKKLKPYPRITERVEKSQRDDDRRRALIDRYEQRSKGK